ncbi:bifunctional (p)ppGpp synthetase/guanosine-3',5'-bis(diphosphate) 3'-pyrophosphohydrolase [Sutterella sp.]|uniref:RelA/SpoT family protein n=1 Tax=Sutterella sp. TaxID=1981025 RepID=UPI0026E0CE24|nr:RelA/SpoT family protein [Sutterella sp.]MDO5531294.1 RelA/SpoT family protein [Sutterella sp.]
MALDSAPSFPDDMYATAEEGSTPLPTPPRKPISPFGFTKHAARRAPLPAPVIPAKLPDADLPLFTPKAPIGVVTAQALVDTCKLYLTPNEVEKIRSAYRYADDAHLGQFRKSGEPYITHPIAVASILASWRMDAETVQAGLMHDVLEDTATSKREMAEKFGLDVADLVDGVSKLDKLKFSSNEIAQAESFRKMLLAMSRDVRVILVKLADRVHNMRTLGAMRPEKRARIARETLDIYVPIAHRLGLNNVFRELQELSFANRYPFRYRVLYENVLKTRQNRREFLEKMLNDSKTVLSQAGIPCRILGRDRTIYGIYNKMREKHQSFSDALDIYGFRIVVRTRDDCYLALGALHKRWKPVNSRFKDFIAIPKSNGYQSIHTTVIGPDGTPVEFQLRTEEMHRIDEDGILVHWLYASSDDTSDLQSRTAAWLQNLLEIQRTTSDSKEFLENIKVDLFPSQIYVFTPKGKIIPLPKGSTAIDFAYEIHTDVGNHTESVRINGEPKPLNVTLRNGDLVQVITAKNAHPSPQWLAAVHSGRARAEIRQYLRSCQLDELTEMGRLALESLASEQKIDLVTIPNTIEQKLAKEFGAENLAALYAQIGLGRALPAAVLTRLRTMLREENIESSDEDLPPVMINGNEGVAQHLAVCCHPIPGDDITGYNRPGIGLTVHREDCPHAIRGKQADPKRWMHLEWGQTKAGAHFAVPLEVRVKEAHAGLATVATAVAEANSSITGVTLEEPGKEHIVHVTVLVRDRNHLIHVTRTIRQNDVVLKVKRVFEEGTSTKRKISV